jgi:2-polyprenyl-3-methyl-5-hydroxy-6-metoxy-1,4-benzoquinol methylase
MDDEAADEAMLRSTLRRFAITNRLFSPTRSLFRRTILQDIKKAGLHRVTIMDVGAGGGDFARWCVTFLKKRGIVPGVLCIDGDKRVVNYIRDACARYPEIRIEHASLFDLDMAAQSVDYVFSGHVLHHHSDARIPKFLGIAWAAARRGMLIVDLKRNRRAFLAFYAFSAIFLRAGMNRSDGLLSIRKGFTLEDVRGYIDAAGLAGLVEVRESAFWHLAIWGMKPHQ